MNRQVKTHRIDNRTFAVIGGVALCAAGLWVQQAAGALAGDPADRGNLLVVADGRTEAVVVVSPEAGLPETTGKDGVARRGADKSGTRNEEWAAANDLVDYIEMMTGAKPRLASTREDIQAALASKAPLLIVGEEALKANAGFARKVRAAAKAKPILGADAIGLLREGNRVYLAGNNDLAHYFAVAELLSRWGCRWYLPTAFGECIPEVRELAVGTLDYAYGSPFEIRSYWISWNGDGTGRHEFQKRNMMIPGRRGFPSTGHALGRYTRDAPGSKGTFEFPITAPETARHVAGQLDEAFAAGKDISVGMEDGNYDSTYPRDVELMKQQWDKYMVRWSVTDAMLELYNNVAGILQNKHPRSPSKLGFLAYGNMTLPPVRAMKAERSLFCELAPIDIDPIHGMDDEQSPPRQEYRDILHAWTRVMQGRLAIYDYDQGMLVWRDLPNPSHQAFRQDVQHYRQAGILGINTESRNAIATTFLNLYLRGRLMWDPDVDVDALLAEFYPKFYGPAAQPMETYWNTIYQAWSDTIVTEHEYFVAPAIYTPEVIETCRKSLAEAEKLAAPLQGKVHRTRQEKQVLERMAFTRLSFEMIDGYLAMARAAATACDYARAAAIGRKTLAVREKLTEMNGTFTTYRRIGEKGPAWWPGEVEQYAKLAELTDGTRGTRLINLPLEWAFRRDKARAGVQAGYATQPVDLSVWNERRAALTPDNRKDYPDAWELLRTDLYAQAQGIRDPDRQSFTGDLWYRVDVELTAAQLKDGVRLMFPGLFNECWLTVNGAEAGYRKQGKLWWLNDYRFEWDVDLTGKLQPGVNTLVLRANCEHHLGGLFRRPFLYAPVAAAAPAQ